MRKNAKDAINRITDLFHLSRGYFSQDGVDIPIDSKLYERLDTFHTYENPTLS